MLHCIPHHREQSSPSVPVVVMVMVMARKGYLPFLEFYLPITIIWIKHDGGLNNHTYED